MRNLALLGLVAATSLSVDAKAENLIIYYDCVGCYAGGVPAELAAIERGDTYVLYDDAVAFAAAYTAGGVDAVIVEAPNFSLPADISTTISAAIGDGVPVVFSWWDLDSDPGLQTTLGVTTVTYGSPVNHASVGGAPDFFASFTPGALTWAGGFDAGDNGDYLTGGTSAATGPGGTTIAITNSDSVIVNGFLHFDFQGQDDDGDGVDDTAEITVNQLDYLFGGSTGPRLLFTGACPGMIQIDIAGLTPGDSFAVARSSTLGSASIPSGPCAGTTLGLAGPSLVGIYPTGSGTQSFMPTIGAGSCGDYVQLVDLASCATSNIEQF